MSEKCERIGNNIIAERILMYQTRVTWQWRNKMSLFLVQNETGISVVYWLFLEKSINAYNKKYFLYGIDDDCVTVGTHEK